MGEFDEKLSSILSDPNAMNQIMALAQNLGGPSKKEAPPPSSPGTDSMDPASLLSSLDPQMLQTGMELLRQFSAQDDEKTALLLALRPFLKEERYAKVDRAVQIARLSRLLRVGFDLFKGRRDDHV